MKAKKSAIASWVAIVVLAFLIGWRLIALLPVAEVEAEIVAWGASPWTVNVDGGEEIDIEIGLGVDGTMYWRGVEE